MDSILFIDSTPVLFPLWWDCCITCLLIHWLARQTDGWMAGWWMLLHRGYQGAQHGDFALRSFPKRCSCYLCLTCQGFCDLCDDYDGFSVILIFRRTVYLLLLCSSNEVMGVCCHLLVFENTYKTICFIVLLMLSNRLVSMHQPVRQQIPS